MNIDICKNCPYVNEKIYYNMDDIGEILFYNGKSEGDFECSFLADIDILDEIIEKFLYEFLDLTVLDMLKMFHNRIEVKECPYKFEHLILSDLKKTE
jgi:hypothetical protein